MRTIFAVLTVAVLAAVAVPASSLAQTGPVGTVCSKDIAKFCKGLRHGSMEVRACLEANRAKISAACRRALDTTGGGRGLGRNR